MPMGANGLPDPAPSRPHAAAGNPVDLETGPGGDLFYAVFDGGAVHRIRYTAAGNAPASTLFRRNRRPDPPR